VEEGAVTTAIDVKHLSKHFGSGDGLIRAVDDVDLVVESGESVVITGPSGCGKSTLLQIMGGLDLPTAGEVWIAGSRIDSTSERSRAKLRRRHVGFVFQDFHLMEELTALENVELPALLAGVPGARARRRAHELLGQFGLSDRAAHRPDALSGGQRQRVAIARALVNGPAVLLADEPTGNLDSASTTDVLRLLEQLRRQGQTLVVVTHDPRTAATADRVLQMRDGALVEDYAVQPSSRSAGDILSMQVLE
jgi:putative ABC transport system ATP-binding protein